MDGVGGWTLAPPIPGSSISAVNMDCAFHSDSRKHPFTLLLSVEA